MQKILGYLRKAIENYNMIDEGDKISKVLSKKVRIDCN